MCHKFQRIMWHSVLQHGCGGLDFDLDACDGSRLKKGQSRFKVSINGVATAIKIKSASYPNGFVNANNFCTE